jgi:hypothetical protein
MAKAVKEDNRLGGKLVKNQIARAVNDIASWQKALKKAEDPTTYNKKDLYAIYKNCSLDSLLSSQLNNRIERTVSTDFVLQDASGAVNEVATLAFKNSGIAENLIREIINSKFWGHSLIQILPDTQEGRYVLELIPRQHVIAEFGLIILKVEDRNGIPYKELPEFNVSVFEFGGGDLGLFNNAVPHVLIKRFAQTSWSQFAELFGTPTRVVKTNTSNERMLSRAEQMLKESGGSAYLILDTNEAFDFAEAVVSNGDVYKNLINLCNNELSLLISGAVIGQDTANGNYSKETASIEILDRLAKSDQRLVEESVNKMIVGLSQMGLVPAGVSFKFKEQEDLAELFDRTVKMASHFDIDPEFVFNKFGIPVTPQANF